MYNICAGVMSPLLKAGWRSSLIRECRLVQQKKNVEGSRSRSIMSKDKFNPINVLNIIRGFHQPKLPHHITPYRFETRTGESHRIVQIRQVHQERSGREIHHHFVVKTSEGRFFHIIFDTGTLTWRMIQEVDEELFFNN